MKGVPSLYEHGDDFGRQRTTGILQCPFTGYVFRRINPCSISGMCKQHFPGPDIQDSDLNACSAGNEALPDADCYTVDLTGMTSQWGASPRDRTFMFAVLVADATCDGMVSTVDASGIKGRLGLPVTEDLCRYDINHDGWISTPDRSSCKARLGNVAPSCP